MKTYPALVSLLFMILSFFCIQACKKAPPVKLQGQIYIRFNDRIIELAESDDPSGYSMNKVAESTYFGSVSPDGNYLLFSNDSATFLRNLAAKSITTILNYPINNVCWSPDSRMFCYKTYWNYLDRTGPSSELFVYQVSDNTFVPLYRGRIETYMGAGSVTESVDGMVWLSAKELLFQCGSFFPDRINSNELWRDGHALRAENTVIGTIGEQPLQPLNSMICTNRLWVRGIAVDGSFLLYSKSETAYDPHFIDHISNQYFIADKWTLSHSDITPVDILQGANIKEIDCSPYEKVGIITGTSILYYIKNGEWNDKILIFTDPVNLKKKLKRSIEYLASNEFCFIMDPDEKLIAYFDQSGLNIYEISSKRKIVIHEDFPEYRINEYSSPSFGELLGWSKH
ncbi:MAG TPA: hypothetical protein PK711_11505 [Bacteroidales bacterium]|nr:hypothetical protein [Bacteroidales bacterium]